MHHWLCSCLPWALWEWEGQLFCAFNMGSYFRGILWAGRDSQGSSNPALGLAQDTPAMPPCASEHCPNISCSSAQELVLPLLSACFCIFIYDSRPFWDGSFRCLFLSLCQYKLFSRAAIIFHAFVTIFSISALRSVGFFPPSLNVTPLALQQSLHMAESSWTHLLHPTDEGGDSCSGMTPKCNIMSRSRSELWM